MKQLGTTLLFAIVMLGLAGCGSTSNSGTPSSDINGNWTANLADNNNNTVFAFTTTLTSNSDNTVTGTNLSFTTNNACFANGATETGTLVLTGNFNGNVNGDFGLQIQGPAAGASGNNTINMQGKVNNGTITGTWTLTGLQSGCTGSGNFTMNKM